jgi:hypothetical protein
MQVVAEVEADKVLALVVLVEVVLAGLLRLTVEVETMAETALQIQAAAGVVTVKAALLVQGVLVL